ncbi:hypothetical protein GCM10022409_38690 [Hymenobacter glaciei]|uniref:SHOCT domain-containing protein n=1 Tax=Hymenobacter glaciei TaxID=877209 RepID=A0ABP7UNN8_9BACT
MENPSSPLETLRQLKEMLDAGALTPIEFDALKQRLVFTPGAAGAAAEPTAAPVAPVVPAAPILPPAPAWPVVAAPPVPATLPAVPTPPAAQVAAYPTIPAVPPVASTPPEPLPPAPFYASLSSSVPPAPEVVEVDALVFEPVAEPMFMSEASADFPVAVGGPSYVNTEALPDDEETDLAAVPAERNSSLGLVLAIAGVLVFLAVVAYLNFNRPASEHISSTSQTAADSVATTIETGPQVAPLPTTSVAPETVRVAPTNPAPVIQPRPAAPVADTVAPVTNSSAPDTAANR